MLTSLILLLSLSSLHQDAKRESQQATGQISIPLRTLDAKGKRLADCPVYFVQADAPGLRPATHPKPLRFRSNQRGLLFAKLPAGHAWKVFAYKKGPEVPIATGLLDLSSLEGHPDLVLTVPRVRHLRLKGLSSWRSAFPSGLELILDCEGLLSIPLALPATDEEVIVLPPIPRSSFSVSLEHEDFGTLDRIHLRLGERPDPKVTDAVLNGLLPLTLGQPVKVEGRILGTVNEPIAGARIRLLLPLARNAISLRSIRSDDQGRFRLWFPWRPVRQRGGVPQLLISAPGNLLRLEPLRDLCEWISIKTATRIDPKILEGLDLAGKRVIRMERAFPLTWTVLGWKPTDRFFMKLRLPVERAKRVYPSSFLLPVPLDSKGRLELPGDSLVRDSQGQELRKIRFMTRARRFELYLLRDGLCEQLAYVEEEALEMTKVIDLGAQKSVTVRVQSKGKVVTDARFQVVRVLGRKPMFSAPRRMPKSGVIQLDLGGSDYWIFVESKRKGQGYRRIKPGDQGPEPITIKLTPLRAVRIRHAHPDPDSASLPMRLDLRTSISSSLPSWVGQMVFLSEMTRRSRMVHSLEKEEIVVHISPWVDQLDATLRETSLAGRGIRPIWGNGRVLVEREKDKVLELNWR